MESFLKLHNKTPTQSSFDHLADLILNRCQLTIRNETCRICEVEFYLKSTDHPDPYVHCDEHQREWGRLYFHRINGRGFKGGTFKGMDITLGNGRQYMGCLIRSLYSETSDRFITGPCLCVNYLLEQFGFTSVDKLARELSIPVDLLGDGPIRLVDFQPDGDGETVYHAPRVGLSDKSPEYRDRKYRYAIRTRHIKREKTKFSLGEPRFPHSPLLLKEWQGGYGVCGAVKHAPLLQLDLDEVICE